MEILIQAGQLILSLSILIVLHEFGHYLPARAFKTRVEKFYLFFDYKFSIFKKKIKDTEWGIGWIPLGGYVKISGMIDESMDKEQMEQPPQPWEFRTKPAWQRLIIMIGGIVVNLIVGMVIYSLVLFTWGKEYIAGEDLPHGLAVSQEYEAYGFQDGDMILEVGGEKLKNVLDVNKYILLRGSRDIKVQHPDGEIETIQLREDADYELFQSGNMSAFSPRINAKIGEVVPEMPASKAGLLKNDIIKSVNDYSINYWDQFSDTIKKFKNEEVLLVVERDGVIDSIMVLPDTVGQIGVAPDGAEFKSWVKTEKFSFFESIPAGIGLAYWTLHDYAAQLKFLFTSKGASSMGGFGAFGKMFQPQWDWHTFWLNTALISIILAFMNFLPIPALDGGHIMFLLYEMITGRKPHQKVLEYAQIIGFILILGLVLYANGNDIYKAITGK
ncbi:MAG: RIP metalloprotease RseP [Crocinitomicaceae bacterium]|nr:RIP metalloprotease RseP [Crocinitomicaceae bacterium]